MHQAIEASSKAAMILWQEATHLNAIVCHYALWRARHLCASDEAFFANTSKMKSAQDKRNACTCIPHKIFLMMCSALRGLGSPQGLSDEMRDNSLSYLSPFYAYLKSLHDYSGSCNASMADACSRQYSSHQCIQQAQLLSCAHCDEEIQAFSKWLICAQQEHVFQPLTVTGTLSPFFFKGWSKFCHNTINQSHQHTQHTTHYQRAPSHTNDFHHQSSHGHKKHDFTTAHVRYHCHDLCDVVVFSSRHNKQKNKTREHKKTKDCLPITIIVSSPINKAYVFDVPEYSMVKELADSGCVVVMIQWRETAHIIRKKGLYDYVCALKKAHDEIMRWVISRAPNLFAHTAQHNRIAIHFIGHCMGGHLLQYALNHGENTYQERDTAHQNTSQTITTPYVKTVTLLTTPQILSAPWKRIFETPLYSLCAPYVQSTVLKNYSARWFFDMLRPEHGWFSENHYSDHQSNETCAWLLHWSRDPANLSGQLMVDYARHVWRNDDFELCHVHTHQEGKKSNTTHPMTLGMLHKMDIATFSVACIKDHLISPDSCYKASSDGDGGMFCLVGGGHVSGIFTTQIGSAYRVGCMDQHAYKDWKTSHPAHQGPWRKHWIQWLLQHSK